MTVGQPAPIPRQHGITPQLHALLADSRVGRRWERMARTHAPEVMSLMAVHPDLRRHVDDALTRLAAVAGDHGTLDDATVRSATAALDDLCRLGGFDLRHAVIGVREELAMACGRGIDEVLTGG